MTTPTTDFEKIRRMRRENPKMRERDLANTLEVSEADLVAAECGLGARRIEVRFDEIFKGLADVGEVLALTRNESAVHEKPGVYDRFIPGKGAAMMLGAQIDTRMFPAVWKHGFAVEKTAEDGSVKKSLQFFDKHGDAVHKIHTREATDMAAWDALVESLVADDQAPVLSPAAVPAEKTERTPADPSKAPELRERWQAMTDTHQFHGMLRELELHRLDALAMTGEERAWKLQSDAVVTMLHKAAETAVPIMCFVGSRGCIQIHTGPVSRIAAMGPWINIMDPGFHLHLRTDHIVEVWAVRKPCDAGHVTSIEAYDADGTLVIQFFGERKEGLDELPEWRTLVEELPRTTETETVLEPA
uniref:hemin-degrading factor n=1 Tax=Stappia sp. TaxID=1870903 RepID=UPI003BAD9B22